jgi:hypothetical protein
MMANHFWLGSLCLFQGRASLPAGVISIADSITVMQDLGNRIPDKSWMLYLLEVFDRRARAPVELNLICQFNDRDNFWAIFGGVNRYKFTSVLPAVGHTYLRQIILQRQSRSVEYRLTDRTTGQAENFVFNVSGIAYECGSHFSGIEWWNKLGGGPFPVRYRVRISELMFGVPDGQGITYMPYDGLVPDKDPNGDSYPVSLANPAAENGYVSYDVTDGAAKAGLRFARGQPATL